MAENKVKLMDTEGYRQFISLLLAIKSGQDSKIDQCLLQWQPNTVIEKDKYYVVLDNNNTYYSMYQCIATHQSTDTFNESYFKCIDSTNVEYFENSQLEEWLNLSTEELQNLQSLLHDEEISTSYTHSSSKIYSSIQDAINVAKAYTNAQLGKAVKPAYMEVPSTSEMTDAHYIYLLSNGTNFDMYILENGTTPKKIGTSDIDISNLVKVEDLERDYSTTAECDGKYATITTVDGKADKSSIVTPSATSTTDQIANAKDTYDMINTSNNVIKKMFTDSNGGDFIDVLNENVSPSDQKVYILGFNNLYTNLPNQTSGWWNVQISGVFSERMCIAKDTWSEAIYTGYIWYDSANTTWKLVRWEKVQTEKDFLKLADLSNDGYARISSWVDSNNGRTQMSFDINTTGGKVERIQFDDIDGQLSVYENDGADNWTWKGNYIRTKVPDLSLTQLNLTSNFSGGVFYQVKGGYCTVYICNLTCTITGNGQVVSNDLLPNPVAPVITSPVEHDSSDIKVGLGYVDIDIRLLKMHVYKNALNGYATFSYPVQEP